MDILINIKNKIAELAEPARIVCGNSDYTAVFAFDAEWAAYQTKTARFMHGGSYTDVVFKGDRCPMPVMRNTTGVYVGVFAGDLHTSTPAYISCEKSILCDGGTPADPTPDVYAQILGKINDGTIKGEQGERGEKGEKGDAGAIKFKSVVSLPTENIDDTAIYLVPIADGVGENRFTEYAYIDGKWETLGAISIQVDHSEYVKFTQLNEALGGKLDKLTIASQVYVTKADGSGHTGITYSSTPQANTIARRQGTGALAVGDANNPSDAVPLAQMNTALDGKLDKASQVNSVYGIDTAGKQINFPISQNAATGGTMVFRRQGGRIATGTATDDIDAVPLAQLNTILDERIGSLDAALDEVLALQAFYTGETFDEIHEYAEGVIAGGDA